MATWSQFGIVNQIQKCPDLHIHSQCTSWATKCPVNSSSSRMESCNGTVLQLNHTWTLISRTAICTYNRLQNVCVYIYCNSLSEWHLKHFRNSLVFSCQWGHDYVIVGKPNKIIELNFQSTKYWGIKLKKINKKGFKTKQIVIKRMRINFFLYK